MDNQGAVSFANGPGNYSGRKSVRHMELRYAFIRECVQNGDVAVTYCPTKKNVSDIFTKALVGESFRDHSGALIG